MAERERYAVTVNWDDGSEHVSRCGRMFEAVREASSYVADMELLGTSCIYQDVYITDALRGGEMVFSFSVTDVE